MSDPLNASTPSPNEVEPEAGAPEDPAALQSAQALDEDELGADPLEEGVEPPESWSEVAEGRPTPREQRAGGSLESRLDAERPDQGRWSVEEAPLAESRLSELDDSVDDRAAAEVADATGEEVVGGHGAVVQGEQVDEAGRSAVTAEGEVTGEDARGAAGSPEERAERIEESGP